PWHVVSENVGAIGERNVRPRQRAPRRENISPAYRLGVTNRRLKADYAGFPLKVIIDLNFPRHVFNVKNYYAPPPTITQTYSSAEGATLKVRVTVFESGRVMSHSTLSHGVLLRNTFTSTCRSSKLWLTLNA